MDAPSRRILNALKTAIRREERTALAYEAQAKKMDNPAAQAILVSLAKQETHHAKKLKRVLDQGGDLSGLGRRGKNLANKLHVINDDIRVLEKKSATITVLRRALKSEMNSVRLYRSLEKIYQGLDVAVLFGKLAEEEERHTARLEKLLPRV